jgi:hypothetical protein
MKNYTQLTESERNQISALNRLPHQVLHAGRLLRTEIS